jgi:hypothetical protein
MLVKPRLMGVGSGPTTLCSVRLSRKCGTVPRPLEGKTSLAGKVVKCRVWRPRGAAAGGDSITKYGRSVLRRQRAAENHFAPQQGTGRARRGAAPAQNLWCMLMYRSWSLLVVGTLAMLPLSSESRRP